LAGLTCRAELVGGRITCVVFVNFVFQFLHCFKVLANVDERLCKQHSSHLNLFQIRKLELIF